MEKINIPQIFLDNMLVEKKKELSYQYYKENNIIPDLSFFKDVILTEEEIEKYTTLYLINRNIKNENLGNNNENESEIIGNRYNDYGDISKSGDIAFWDNKEEKVKTISLARYNKSLGEPVGVVVVPKGFAPDNGKIRICGLESPGPSTYYLTNDLSKCTELRSYNALPCEGRYYGEYSLRYANKDVVSLSENNADSDICFPMENGDKRAPSKTDNKCFYKIMLKYDTYTVPSPYICDLNNNENPNPFYCNPIVGYNNALYDFNGLESTLKIKGNTNCISNYCWNYKDGISNLQWYMPSMGEIGYIPSRYNEIDYSITYVGGETLGSSKYCTSTFYKTCGSCDIEMYGVYLYTGKIEKYCTDEDVYFVSRSFAQID